MFIQNKIEESAAKIVSSSLAAANVTTWEVRGNFDAEIINPPLVKVVCDKSEPLYPQLNIGISKVQLSIVTFAVKAETAAQDFESVSNTVMNPFFANNIAATLQANTTNVTVKCVYETGFEVVTLEDGWMATLQLEVVAGRTS